MPSTLVHVSRDGVAVRLRRPTFGEIEGLHFALEELLLSSTVDQAVQTPGFAAVMWVASTTEADHEAIQAMPAGDVWRLWLEYEQFAHFRSYTSRDPAANLDTGAEPIGGEPSLEARARDVLQRHAGEADPDQRARPDSVQAWMEQAEADGRSGEIERAKVYDYYAAEYGWTPQQVDDTDYWLIVVDLPFAARRRRALAALTAIEQEVVARGPEGEQVHYDHKGKRVRSKARVEYHGFNAHLKRLRVEAGLDDPRVSLIVEELRRSDAFWGGVPDLDSALPVRHDTMRHGNESD